MNTQELYRSPNRMHERQYFYKYTSASTARIVLLNRTLRWSSPIEFNDPFDVTQELRLNFDEATLQHAMATRMAALVENGDVTPVNNPQVRALLAVIRLAPPELRRKMAEDIRKVPEEGPTSGQIDAFHQLREMWRNMVAKFRVLCLSELKDVTSMWLHYADSYRGIVLEFEANDRLDSPLLVARPVLYQDEPPAIADVDEWIRCMTGESARSYEHLFTEYQYVKTTDWAYEREWRIVSMARPGETENYADYPFHPKELVGVYFGPNCSAQDREDITFLLDHGLEHVRPWQATHDHGGARFVFERLGT